MPLIAPARIPQVERTRDAAWRDTAPTRQAVSRLPVSTRQTAITRDDLVPVRMHTHQMAQGPTGRGDGINGAVNRQAQRVDPHDALGSLEWSPDMARYLAGEVVALFAEEALAASDWPESPYVVARLIYLLGQDAVDAVMALRLVNLAADELRETDWHAAKVAIAAHYQQSLGWLYRQERRVNDLVRARYRLRTARRGARDTQDGLRTYRPHKDAWQADRRAARQTAAAIRAS